MLLSRAERGEISGFVCATTVTTIHYLCAKVLGKRETRKKVRALLGIVEVAPVTRNTIQCALDSRINDFEDAVISEAAAFSSVHVIATRNKKDYSNSKAAVYEPGELLNLLDAGM
jgi:predicted nucleic acid-binding protein